IVPPAGMPNERTTPVPAVGAVVWLWNLTYTLLAALLVRTNPSNRPALAFTTVGLVVAADTRCVPLAAPVALARY
ncbi:MAG: hypothetical protein ACK53L_09625, partial [Pirellulaceae bacterium]